TSTLRTWTRAGERGTRALRRSGGLRSAGLREEKQRGHRGQRGAEAERRGRRDVIPYLARHDRCDEQATPGDQVVETKRAPPVALRHRRGDERALGAFRQAGDQAVGCEQRPGVPPGGGQRETDV